MINWDMVKRLNSMDVKLFLCFSVVIFMQSLVDGKRYGHYAMQTPRLVVLNQVITSQLYIYRGIFFRIYWNAIVISIFLLSLFATLINRSINQQFV